MTAHDEVSELYCPGCSYSLRGIESARCPECGVELDWAKLGVSKIPWVHRREVGRVRGFLKTVWLVIARPGEVGREANRAVGYRDAQSFRWIVVASATVPLWGWILAGQIIWGHGPPGTPSLQPVALLTAPRGLFLDFLICFYAGITLWPVPWIAAPLFLAGLTGIGSYLFHPKSIPVERQDRAIALSYYASASLTLMVVPAILFGALIVLHQFEVIDDTRQLSLGTGALLFITWVGAALVPALLYYDYLRVLFVATDQSVMRVGTASLLLPLFWIVIGLLTLILFPMMAGFLRIVFLSYWL